MNVSSALDASPPNGTSNPPAHITMPTRMYELVDGYPPSVAAVFYSRPATRFVADLIGTMNVLAAIPQGGQIRLADGITVPYAGRFRGGQDKQMVVEVGGAELQAFVSPDFTATECRLTFSRAMVYHNDTLVE